MGERKYLFGPVPSRRLGRSLGVDLTPYKTCSLDCIFCQLGRTTDKTLHRREYVPAEEVMAELKGWLEGGGQADYITLSGSGEPTLHSRFGEVLDFVRSHTTIPVALLTNGTLLTLPQVREAASLANVVKMSLSAWDQASYRWVNRPHQELGFAQLIEGETAFRARFKGDLWVEVFLVAAVNSAPADVSKISTLVREIRPHRVHLNTCVRPPAEGFAQPISKDQMTALCPLFDPPARVIAEFTTDGDSKVKANKDTILSMLKRRPCTAEQIARVFGMHPNEVSKYLGNLLGTRQIHAETENGAIYYRAVREEIEGVNNDYPNSWGKGRF